MHKISAKKNYIYNVISQIVAILTPIITTPYVSRVLTVAGVGRASFSTSLITYFAVFAALGFSLYAQREVAKHGDDEKEKSKIFWEVNICRLLSVALALAVNAVLLMTNVYQGNTVLMLILSINIIAVGFDITFFYQGNENFGKVAFVNVSAKLMMVASIFLFVKSSSDVWIYVLINSLGLFVGYFVMWFFLVKYLTKVSVKELRPLKHLKGTLHLFLPTIAITLYADLDKSLIGFLSDTSVQNGYYEQAEKIAKVALTVITCMGVVMIPRNSKNYVEGNLDAVKQNIYKSMHFVWVMAIPMCLGVVVVSSNFIPWFLGEEFYGSIKLLQVLSLLFLCIGFSNVVGVQYILPTMRDKKYTYGIFFGVLINIIVSIPLIVYLKALGACIATGLAEFSVALMMFLQVRKELLLKEIFKTIWKPLLSGIMMFGVIFPLSMLLSPSILNTFIIVLVGMLTYGLMILALKDELVITLLKQLYNKVFKRNR